MSIFRRYNLTGVAIAITLVIVLFFFYRYPSTSEFPAISASIRMEETNTDSIALLWIIKNKSQQTITFDENNIMQVELNGSQVLYPTLPYTLVPDEEITLKISLNVNTTEINRVKISAISKEGTVATIKETIYPRG